MRPSVVRWSLQRPPRAWRGSKGPTRPHSSSLSSCRRIRAPPRAAPQPGVLHRLGRAGFVHHGVRGKIDDRGSVSQNLGERVPFPTSRETASTIPSDRCNAAKSEELDWMQPAPCPFGLYFLSPPGFEAAETESTRTESAIAFHSSRSDSMSSLEPATRIATA